MAAAETARLIASLESRTRTSRAACVTSSAAWGAWTRSWARSPDSSTGTWAAPSTPSRCGLAIHRARALSSGEAGGRHHAGHGCHHPSRRGLVDHGRAVANWANQIEADTEAAFDDKDIVAATTTLIRYGKVSDENLRPAMEVMTDLAARTGDVESAATLLGKALADPAKAAGKLARSGVILTKAQQKQIKAMVRQRHCRCPNVASGHPAGHD